MKLKIADVFNTREVVHFFSRHLIRGNDGVSTSEFFCPDGVKAAVRRGQVLLALHDKHVIAALRFYRRKTKNSVSLYQFAIDLPYRGQGLLREMLQSLGPVPIEYLCPPKSSFNDYFDKTGWILLESDYKYNRWVFNPGGNG